MKILNNLYFPVIVASRGIFADSEEVLIMPHTLGEIELEAGISWNVVLQEVTDTTGYTLKKGNPLCLKKGASTVYIRHCLDKPVI